MKLPESHTPGNWAWQKFSKEWELATVPSSHDRLIVMDFERSGMQGAQPRFADRPENQGGILYTANEWGDLLPQHPDAALIAAAPTLAAACEWALSWLTNVNVQEPQFVAGLLSEALLRARVIDLDTAADAAKAIRSGPASAKFHPRRAIFHRRKKGE